MTLIILTIPTVYYKNKLQMGPDNKKRVVSLSDVQSEEQDVILRY